MTQKEFGTKLKAERIKKDLTQPQAAVAIGISSAYLSTVELGNAALSVKYAKSLDKVFKNKNFGEELYGMVSSDNPMRLFDKTISENPKAVHLPKIREVFVKKRFTFTTIAAASGVSINTFRNFILNKSVASTSIEGILNALGLPDLDIKHYNPATPQKKIVPSQMVWNPDTPIKEGSSDVIGVLKAEIKERVAYTDRLDSQIKDLKKLNDIYSREIAKLEEELILQSDINAMNRTSSKDAEKHRMTIEEEEFREYRSNMDISIEAVYDLLDNYIITTEKLDQAKVIFNSINDNLVKDLIERHKEFHRLHPIDSFLDELDG